MSRTARKQSSTGIYHIMHRGVGKQILFEDEQDYQVLYNYLMKYKAEEKFELYAYCFMDNHFHLLIKAEENLDRIIKKIATSYAHYFNTKYGRVGHLFQDRFKSEPVEADSYFHTVMRYIHNNPEKAGICSRAEYPWSSYREYVGQEKLVDVSFLFDQIGGFDKFEDYSKTIDEEECLDEDYEPSNALLKMNQLVKDTYGILPVNVRVLNRSRRNEVLEFLYKNGCSMRTIERMTGVSRGAIQHICLEKGN